MSNELKHICGVCSEGFETEEQYCDHKCSDGFTPKDAEHLGEEFMAVSEAAVARGEERKAQE